MCGLSKVLLVISTFLLCFDFLYAQVQWSATPPQHATNAQHLVLALQGPAGSTSQISIESSFEGVPDPRVANGGDLGSFTVALNGGNPSQATFNITLSHPGLHQLTVKVNNVAQPALAKQITIYPTEIIIGGSFDGTWSPDATTDMAIQLAFELINSDPTILPFTKLALADPVYANCSPSLGISTSLPLFQNTHISALIGPSCSGVAQVVSTLAQVYQVPIIGYDASTPLLSNKDAFPYFLRVVAPSYYESLSLISFAQQMGWNPVSLVMLDTYQMSPDVFRIAERMKVTIAASVIIPTGSSYDEVYRRMTAIKTAGSRVIITNIYGDNADVKNTFQAADALNLIGQGSTWLFEGSAAYTINNFVSDEMAAKFNGSFTLAPGDIIGNKTLRRKAIDLWNTKDPQSYIKHPDRGLVPMPAYENAPGQQNTLFGDLSRSFDAAYVIAKAVHQIFYTKPLKEPFDGEQLKAAMMSLDFFGISGDVGFDINGDFHVPWAINNLRFKQDPTSGTGGLLRRAGLQKDSVLVANIVPLDDFQFDMQLLSSVEQIWFSSGVGIKPAAFYCEQGCDHGTCISHNKCVCDKDWLDAPNGRACSIPVVENVVNWTSGAGIAIVIIAALLILIMIASMIALYVFRREPGIRAISPLFCGIFVFGLLLVAGGILGYIGRPTTPACLAQTWLISTGYSLAMGALFTKTWRLMRIFGNEKLHNAPLTDKRISLLTILVVAVNIALLAIWTAVEPPEPRRFDLDNGFSYRCISRNGDDGSFIAILAYTGSLMLINTIVAYRTRGITTKHNESRFIGIAVYNVALCSLLVIAVVYGIPQTSNVFRFLITVIACIVSITVAWLLLIGRPLFLLWQMRSKKFGDVSAPDILSITTKKPGAKPVHMSNDTMTYMSVPVEDQSKWVKQWKKSHLAFIYSPVGVILLREEGKDSGIFADRTQAVATLVDPTPEYTDCFELRLGPLAFIVQANSTEEANKWVDLIGAEGKKNSITRNQPLKTLPLSRSGDGGGNP
ncbi:periplasmic binding protein-like I [Phlyctochytrium arcticum]|nr:periplasmic binding protein-like I [Phlyctochytrium arcticum]